MKATLPFKGTRDISGDDMRWRLKVIDTIRDVFVLFGFEPLETPVIERKETLLGKYGEEAENLLFMLAEPHTDGGLRYDHTVPLARFAAANWQSLVKPYKRYVIGPVFRAENPQSGRYRQFYQCDFDTLGSSSLAIDAEIVAINYNVLTRLGFKDEFSVQLNDRELLNSMAEELGFTDANQSILVLRAWDKLDKISTVEASDYLFEQLKSFGVTRETIKDKFEKVTEMLFAMKDDSSELKITNLKKHFKSDRVTQAIEKINNLLIQIDSLGVPKNAYTFNPLLARGLSYYTGPIFETVVNKAGRGSITGGGRYDQLIAAMGGPSVPASGSSFGLDRLLVVMDEMGLRPTSSQITQVFVTLFDSQNVELTAKTLQITNSLRLAGINTEVYSGDPVKIGKQIEIAVKKNIPYLLVLGSEEMADNKVILKDLSTREEQKIDIEAITQEISNKFTK